MNIKLDVSIGEAIDKFSILSIKLNKVNKNKLVEVLNEFDTIKQQVQPYVDSNSYQYKLLLNINEEIWNLQDIFRSKYSTNLNDTTLCDLAMQIIQKNDQRFRIKNKINILCKTSLKEQKGYNDKKLLVFPHSGMGDYLTVFGAIRQLSLDYDEVKLVVVNKYLDSVKFMYRDDPTITFLPIERTEDFSPNFGNHRDYIKDYIESGYIYKGCFQHKIGFNHNYNTPIPFWEIFYSDLDLDYNSYRWKFNFNRDLIRESNFYNQNKPDSSYVFIHHNSINYIDFDYLSPKTLFNPDKCNVVSNIIMDYSIIIENAEEIHILDSSFYCLCNYLDLSRVKQKVVYTRCHNLETYTRQTGWIVKHL